MASTKIVTGKHTVFSYLHALEPKVPMGDGTPKYSVSLIIPKSDTVTVAKIKAAIEAAYEEGKSKLRDSKGRIPTLKELEADKKCPLHDGDAKGDPAYKDSYYVNATSVTPPGIVDANREDILDRNEIYSGIIGRASINFYVYNKNGNKGIGCGLNHLQKLADGTPLNGRTTAQEDFADLDDDEDDDDFLS